jgi:rSAM/selenodomain-associated transferase 2
MIGVVIPTLNAAVGLEAAVACVRSSDLVDEIAVSDGGSVDGTVELARRLRCQVVVGPRGRGGQLARGAEAVSAPWLLFLHADTRLAPGWDAAAHAFGQRTPGMDRAAAFRFALDAQGWRPRLLERIVAARCRLLALPYGDQGLLIPRALYDNIGGYRPLPLMEDVDIVRRLGRGRLEILAARAVTSAVRYARDGYLARTTRNMACLGLYFAGVPPHSILRLYE